MQIAKAIEQLSSVTQQNSAASEQMSSTAEELSSQAEQLQEIVTFFNTGHKIKDSVVKHKKTKTPEFTFPEQKSNTKQLKPGEVDPEFDVF